MKTASGETQAKKSGVSKTLVQVVLPLAIIIGVIGGLAFMSQYTSSPPITPKGGSGNQAKEPPTSPLVTEERIVVWDAKEPAYWIEFEKGSTFHYDFWIANRNPKPVSVTLQNTSCTCSQVEIGIFKREAGQSLVSRFPDLREAKDL